MVQKRHLLTSPMDIHGTVRFQPIHTNYHIITAQRKHLQIGAELVTVHCLGTVGYLLVTLQLTIIRYLDSERSLSYCHTSQYRCQSCTHKAMRAPRVDKQQNLLFLNKPLQTNGLRSHFSIHCRTGYGSSNKWLVRGRHCVRPFHPRLVLWSWTCRGRPSRRRRKRHCPPQVSASILPTVRLSWFSTLGDLQGLFLQICQRNNSIQILGIVHNNNNSDFIFQTIYITRRK